MLSINNPQPATLPASMMADKTDESEIPLQCIFINENGSTKPPNNVIPFNDNSTRALSKKNRVYVLRDFLFLHYESCLATDSTVLDVAGGRGDLSWILRNIDGINPIIADPRIPNHRRLVKSVNFLLDHPEEAAVRSVEGLPTHQPLAKLLPRLLANNGITKDSDSTKMNGNHGEDLPVPTFMRIHVDNTLVETLRKIISTRPLEDGLRIWDEYWEEEQRRINSNKIWYGGTDPKAGTAVMNDTQNNQIAESRVALKVFQSLDFIVGFHPDQGTEATIDLALLLGIPFAVVPCCVFPSEFPNRTLDGKRVRMHSELVEYLCMKHPKIRKEKLPFIETDTAKNVVLYMLKKDLAMV